ncbi:MAG: hypothetical protein L3K08_06240 [Thermoplasmata archaeon]|nr:hypothetical protein [Thermoplasmata archaeon]
MFGLTVTPNRRLFHFRLPQKIPYVPETAGIELNFDSAVVATSDGVVRAVDVRPVLRIQSNMARKRQSVARTIFRDQRHPKAVERRYGRRERRRTEAKLHGISNAMIRAVAERAIVVEDLTGLTHDKLRREPHRSPRSRRRLSGWTHGRLVTMLADKSPTPMVRVNPGGTSQG